MMGDLLGSPRVAPIFVDSSHVFFLEKFSYLFICELYECGERKRLDSSWYTSPVAERCRGEAGDGGKGASARIPSELRNYACMGRCSTRMGDLFGSSSVAPIFVDSSHLFF